QTCALPILPAAARRGSTARGHPVSAGALGTRVGTDAPVDAQEDRELGLPWPGRPASVPERQGGVAVSEHDEARLREALRLSENELDGADPHPAPGRLWEAVYGDIHGRELTEILDHLATC